MAAGLILLVVAASVALLASFAGWIAQRKRTPNDTRIPPGPKGIPWLGPVHELPRFGAWFQFKRWSDKYGPIYTTELVGKKHVFITNERMAKDLLSKRANIYSDRPSVPSIVDSKSSNGNGDGTGEYLPLMGRNSYWKRQRKFVHVAMTGAHVKGYHDYPSLEAKRLLHTILEANSNFKTISGALETFASRTICRIVWDNPAHAEDLKESAWLLLNQMSPAGPITNLITPLWHLPWFINPWKQAEKARHDKQYEWFIALQKEVETATAEKRAGPSFTKQYLETKNDWEFADMVEGAFAVGMLAIAAVFTVGSPLHTFILAMVHHPQWLKAVQEELDRELEPGRAPEVEDAPRLPMLRAAIKECLRWRPPVPTGVAHELEQDDIYDGYLLEKGSRIHPVEWAFTRDEAIYPSPEDYNPMRWLDPSFSHTYREPLTEHPSIQGFTTFGQGHRTCMGQRLTDQELLLACGGMAAMFDIRKKKDQWGRNVPVAWNKYNSLLIIKPDPFEFEMVPRSEKHAEAVREMFKSSLERDPHRDL